RLFPVELQGFEREVAVVAGFMAAQSRGAAGETPCLPSFPARRLGVGNRESPLAARRSHQSSVGLLVVPLIGVAVPLPAVVEQDLRLQPPPGFRLAPRRLQ